MSRLLTGLAMAFVIWVGSLCVARAADTGPPSAPPNLTTARAMIKAKDYAGCVKELRPKVDDYSDADLFNLMGFCLRKTGDQKMAFFWYEKALRLQPNHIGALEYLGELYVETGQIDKAKANLARLQKLCPKGCEQLEDLEEAIDKAPKG